MSLRAVLGLACASLIVAAASAGPSAAGFGVAHASNCADHAARAKLIACGAAKVAGNYECRYKLPETDGSWKEYKAHVAADGAAWKWIDGETRCYVSSVSELH